MEISKPLASILIRTYFTSMCLFIGLLSLMAGGRIGPVVILGILSDALVLLLDLVKSPRLSSFSYPSRQGQGKLKIFNQKKAVLLATPIVTYLIFFTAEYSNSSTPLLPSLLLHHIDFFSVLYADERYAADLEAGGFANIGTHFVALCNNILALTYALLLCNAILSGLNVRLVYTSLTLSQRKGLRKILTLYVVVYSALASGAFWDINNNASSMLRKLPRSGAIYFLAYGLYSAAVFMIAVFIFAFLKLLSTLECE